MADNILYIHTNKLAVPYKKYVDTDGTIYIGQKDGRLSVKTPSTTDLNSLEASVTSLNIALLDTILKLIPRIKTVVIDVPGPIAEYTTTIEDASITKDTEVVAIHSSSKDTDPNQGSNILLSSVSNIRSITFKLTSISPEVLYGKYKITYIAK